MGTPNKVLSWLMPLLPMFTGVGFTLVTFITGTEVNETHVQLLDYLLVSTLGAGAIGATKSGFSKYQEYKAKPQA
jgi:hypothetical protein